MAKTTKQPHKNLGTYLHPPKPKASRTESYAYDWRKPKGRS